MTGLRNVDAALEYADRHRLPVFPLVGKVPPAGTAGFHDATTDPARIVAMFRDPKTNIGAVPGPGGFLVIDLDSDTATRWAGALGLLAEPTPTVRTGRADAEGVHRWYRRPDPRPIGNLRLKLANGRLETAPAGEPALEIRCDSGYCVMPPSRHPDSGRRYAWLDGLSLDDVPAVPLPPRFAALLRDHITRQSRGARPPIGDIIAEGARNATLASIGGALRRRGCSEAMITTALAAVNAAHCRPPLNEREVETIAASVARYKPAGAPLADPFAGCRMSRAAL